MLRCWWCCASPPTCPWRPTSFVSAGFVVLIASNLPLVRMTHEKSRRVNPLTFTDTNDLLRDQVRHERVRWGGMTDVTDMTDILVYIPLVRHLSRSSRHSARSWKREATSPLPATTVSPRSRWPWRATFPSRRAAQSSFRRSLPRPTIAWVAFV